MRLLIWQSPIWWVDFTAAAVLFVHLSLTYRNQKREKYIDLSFQPCWGEKVTSWTRIKTLSIIAMSQKKLIEKSP